MGIAIWGVLTILILAFFWWVNRLLVADEDTGRFDAGLAIIEFNRAFPDEAIREVLTSADGKMIFLRLWDGKAGCMRPMGHHFQCHIIQPGKVTVQPTDSPKALAMVFHGTHFPGGIFTFRSQREAAEVSLWLLGSFVVQSVDDMTMPSPA